MQKEKIITKKGSKITAKGNERHEDVFPDRETSYPIGTVFLTDKGGDEISFLEKEGLD